MNSRLNILVTGAEGQLGKSIRKVASNSDDNYIFTDIQQLDITDRKAVADFISDNKIDVVVNCAAFTNVDAAENNEEAAMKINAEAPGILAEELKKHDGFLIHISTDYVFGGSGMNTPIKEDQSPSPTGVYGKSKLLGEENIAGSGAKAIILRTAWLYSDYGNNFVTKILQLLSNRDKITVVFDQCGTPTYAADLATAIADIIAERKLSGYEGTYHFSNEGVCSWYDFALAAKDLAGLTHKTILPCHSSEFPSNVVRPPYSVLDKTKYKTTFGKTIPHWHQSLSKLFTHQKLKYGN